MTGAARTSVAMATCEGQRFIDAQLESIAGQSMPPSELIVCDDASTDDTASRVRAFADRAAFPVRLLVNPQRLGITLNFEQALRETSGDLIFFADQDDLWRPEKIETHVAAFERDPSLGMTFSNADVIDAQGQPLGYDLWSSLFFDAQEQRSVGSGGAAEIFMRRVIAAGTTLAFRAEYKSLLLPFPNLYSVHDAWVAFMLACVSECATLPASLIDYRLHDANQVGIRRLSLPAQLTQARRQISEHAFAESAAFFEAARQRFEQVDRPDWQPDAPRMALIDAKIRHMQARDAMRGGFFQRLPVILQEAVRGHYGRFGYGLKSVAQDLFLR
jgi:glycosyltransferase involved in cell wall biosynthesis